jgi:hypothetical protein
MGVKKAKKNIATIIILVSLLASSIIQCTPKSQIIKEDEEAALKRRVQEYWSYKIKGEWEKCYLYESPLYREKVNVEKYVYQNRRSLMKWEEFDILEIWTSGEEGYVKVKTKHRFLIPEFRKAAFEGVFEEKWIKKDSQWYRLSQPM